MVSINKITKHYVEQARKYDKNKRSTMLDVTTREKEVNALIECLGTLLARYDSPRILETGCGNGYTAEQISKKLKVGLECIDFTREMIQLAKKRRLKNAKFRIGNLSRLNYPNASFDIVYSERCLINILSWKKQKKALLEIHRVLKQDGVYIMIEAFTDGLKRLNKARSEIGLHAIKEAFHNRYFNKKELLKFIRNKLKPLPEFAHYRNFLSTYFYGSRVLYPALISPREPKYNTAFVRFFKYLPSYDNYSPIQMHVFKKV